MKKTLSKFFLIFFLLFQFETFADEKNYHKELITDWSRIFPDQNRNAAGPKFFKYIIDKKINYEDFIEFRTQSKSNSTSTLVKPVSLDTSLIISFFVI